MTEIPEAAELAKATTECRDGIYQRLLDKVIKALTSAAPNKTSVKVDLERSIDSVLMSRLIDTIKRKGYDVTRQNGRDQRDGTSRDYLVISWRKHVAN